MPFISSVNTLRAFFEDLGAAMPNWGSPALVSTVNSPESTNDATGQRFGYKVQTATTDKYGVTKVGVMSESNMSGLFQGYGSNIIDVYDITDNTAPNRIHAIQHPDWATGGVFTDFAMNQLWLICSDTSFGRASGADGDPGTYGSGRIWVYYLDGAQYGGTLVATIDNPNRSPAGGGNTTDDDQFGHGMAIGDCEGFYNECHFAVGAMWEDDTDGSATGKVYVYNLHQDNDATLLHMLDNPSLVGIPGYEYYGTGQGDLFGQTIEINDTHVLVGVLNDQGGGYTTSGAVHLFSTSDGAFVRTFLNPNAFGTTAGDRFGSAIGLTSQYVVVGAPYEDQPNTPEWSNASSGKVYIFDVSAGVLLHTLDNPNTSTETATLPGNDNFGYSISATETHVAIGAMGWSNHYQVGGVWNRVTGWSYIYTLNDGAGIASIANPVGAKPDDFSTSGDQFGWSVSMTDENLVIGAPGYDYSAAAYPSQGNLTFSNGGHILIYDTGE